MKNIGKIVNTHGIKGELRVLSNSDFIDIRFKKNNKIFIDNQSYVIENAYLHKNFIVIKLVGKDNINDVIQWKNKNIFAPPLDDHVLEEDEYFNDDLIGLTVYNQNNEELGVVKTIRDGINYNYLMIEGNKKGLVPFKNSFIHEVDIDNQKIIINEIKGLLDEN